MNRFVLALTILAVIMVIGCSGNPPASNTDNLNVRISNGQIISDVGLGARSSGSGFFITNNGVIVTNYHVIKDAPKIVVAVKINSETYDVYPAEVLNRDPTNDLAILKINYNNSNHFKIVKFEPIQLGTRLSAYGFPYYARRDIPIELGIRYTSGDLNSKVGSKKWPGSFQHSVPTQGGNSGGPLINTRNEVVGVVVGGLSPFMTEESWNIPMLFNFGIKSDFVLDMLDNQNIRPGIGNVRNGSDAENATVLVLGYRTGINVVNNTGYPVREFYIRPSGTTNWGRNLLGRGNIGNEDYVNFNIDLLPFSRENRYDIRLVDLANDAFTKTNIAIQPDDIIVFTYKNDFDAAAPTGSTGIRVINETGYTGYYLFIKPAGTIDWGSNLLRTRLAGSRSFTIASLPASRNNRYDIRLVGNDMDTYTKTNITIQPNETIVFTPDNFDIGSTRGAAAPASQPNSGPPVTIVNNTGYLVQNIYLSPTMEDIWGQDRLAVNQQLENGQSVTLNLPHSLSITDEYDFRLDDSNGNAYEKFNVTVTANGRIVITAENQ